MYTSAFFNSKNGDRMYKAESFADYFASFIGNGVFPNPSNGLQVLQGDGMKIIVRPGRAWINGYFFHNQNDYVFTLDGADGVLKRIDRIVVRWSLPDREIIPAVKKGNLSVTPVAPALQRDGDVYELALADVAVNTGVVAITQQNITDLRLNSAYCGMAAGLIQQVDSIRLERNYTERVRYNKAYYSLDAGDGIESEACYMNLSPYEIYEHQLTRCRLCCALNSLPETQGRRIDAHYILGISQKDIAEAEGVAKSRISESITCGLRNMKKHFKNFF